MRCPLPGPLLLVLGLVIFLLCFSPPLWAGPRKGDRAPAFSLRDPEGAWFKLTDLTYRGPARARRSKHVVLLDFFSTDCKPCIKALPKLIKLHNKFKGKAVKLVLLALPEKADTDERKLAAFLKKRSLPFLVLVDSYGKVAGKYVMRKGVVKIPALFVIDKGLVVREVLQKVDSRAQQKLNKLMEKLTK